jgi:hypothetical protein
MASQSGSPGLTIPSPYQALPGIPPNMSVGAAMSAGILPGNAMCSNIGMKSSAPGRPLLECMADGGAMGTATQWGIDNGNSDNDGGNSFGAGGANQTEYPSSGQSSQGAMSNPATGGNNPTFNGQFGG